MSAAGIARPIAFSNTFQGQIVGLSRATGPNDFTRIGINKLRHLRARFFHQLFRLPAIHMGARGGVGKGAFQRQALRHKRRHFRCNRGGGGII